MLRAYVPLLFVAYLTVCSKWDSEVSQKAWGLWHRLLVEAICPIQRCSANARAGNLGF